MKKVWALVLVSLIAPAIATIAQRDLYADGSLVAAYRKTIPGPSVKTIRLSTGVQLEYAEQGNPGGIPVILLHGFTDSWKSFEPVLPYLPSYLHVFALSQRGHGNSSKAANSYKPEDFAADVAAFVKEQGLRSAIIVGHSMGSTNAQSFVSLYPELARALVLVGSFAGFDKPMIHDFKKVIDDLSDPIDSTFIIEFQKSTLTRPVSAGMFQTMINESRKVPAHVWKGVAAGWRAAGYLKSLEKFDKPALIIWGDKDAYCPREDQLMLQRALSNSRLLVYEGTGHANHWEEPARFAKDLSEFVLKHK